MGRWHLSGGISGTYTVEYTDGLCWLFSLNFCNVIGLSFYVAAAFSGDDLFFVLRRFRSFMLTSEPLWLS